MSEPREKTKDEVVRELLEHTKALVTFWEQVKGRDTCGKLEGLAFSLLVMIDGGSCGVCGFNLTPSFHPDDPEYHKSEGENWYPTIVINDEVALHEMFHHTPIPTESKPLTFGELKVGDWFIGLPLDGDDHGHGGFRGQHHIFEKTKLNHNENATRISREVSSHMPDGMRVIKIR